MKTKSHCRQLYDALLPIVTQLRGILDERELSARSKEKLEMIKTELAIIARWIDRLTSAERSAVMSRVRRKWIRKQKKGNK